MVHEIFHEWLPNLKYGQRHWIVIHNDDGQLHIGGYVTALTKKDAMVYAAKMGGYPCEILYVVKNNKIIEFEAIN